MAFGVWTRRGHGTVLGGARIPHGKGTFGASYIDMTRLLRGRHSQRYSLGGRRDAAYGYQATVATGCDSANMGMPDTALGPIQLLFRCRNQWRRQDFVTGGGSEVWVYRGSRVRSPSVPVILSVYQRGSLLDGLAMYLSCDTKKFHDNESTHILHNFWTSTHMGEASPSPPPGGATAM